MPDERIQGSLRAMFAYYMAAVLLGALCLENVYQMEVGKTRRTRE